MAPRPRDSQTHGPAWSRISFTVCLIALLASCASIPTDYARTRSLAFEDTADTALGRGVAARRGAPGDSGSYLLHSGLDAFAARIVLADAAERSIDAQYFLITDGLTGKLFIHRLLRAADRGVRVRLLIDDMETEGYDPGLLALDSHPNFEVRIFNPFAVRGARKLNFLTDFGRVNRRMHNKSFTVDNQVTIVGGRNIGDEYFSASPDLDLGDLDVVSIGPIVPEVSHAFDAYWNGVSAVPVSVVVEGEHDPGLLQSLREKLEQLLSEAKDSPYGEAIRSSDLMQRLDRGRLEFVWGPVHLAYDLPQKAVTAPSDDSTHLGPQLGLYVDATRSELLLVSPYFVPQEEGVEALRALRERGVRVIILTNSLASTDVPAVHSGYAPYRKRLLEAGVELYELNADVALRDARSRGVESQHAGLHAKVFVFDRKRLFVGSFNLDPRSSRLNTEMGVILDSPELSAFVAQRVVGALPQHAYRLQIAGDDRLEWVSNEDGEEVVTQNEPKAGFWRGFSSSLLQLLPIEDQL